MSQHTPGPWTQPMRYSPEHGHEIPSGSIEAGDGRIVACLDGFTEREWAANARLIAQAPAMLGLLRQYAALGIVAYDHLQLLQALNHLGPQTRALLKEIDLGEIDT